MNLKPICPLDVFSPQGPERLTLVLRDFCIDHKRGTILVFLNPFDFVSLFTG